MDHAHCGCQPGYVDGHFHFPHQQTPPRPVTVMAHPPPLLLRPVQPQHMQQHQVNMVSQYYISLDSGKSTDLFTSICSFKL